MFLFPSLFFVLFVSPFVILGLDPRIYLKAARSSEILYQSISYVYFQRDPRVKPEDDKI